MRIMDNVVEDDCFATLKKYSIEISLPIKTFSINISSKLNV